MDSVVYALCGITSVLCAVLLLRGYLRNRMRLLAWSAACFSVLAVSNILVYVDLVIIPSGPDLMPARSVITLIGATILVVGLIWETA